MNIVEALQPDLPARIAIVGGGGKTTAMFQLTRQLPSLVWATTTTHLGTDQLDETDQHFIICEPAEIDLPLLKAQRTTLITGLFTPDDRVKGPEPEVLQRLSRIARAEHISLIVEADGSRSHPIKAPGEDEPVIPRWVRVVIVVAGLSALGKPFSPEWVHRPERFEALTGAHPGEPITMELLTELLVHPQGGLKGIPANAERIALLNQADTPELQEQAANAAADLLAGGFNRVIIGALQKAPQELAVFVRVKR
jgi:probable selenium-dependent hydroxylase accessory protein YqeC